MFRMDTPTTGATPPTMPAAAAERFPQSADPSTGVPATIPGPWWFHMITEELRNIVVAAALTPAKNVLTQVLQALTILFGGGRWLDGFDIIVPGNYSGTVPAGATRARVRIVGAGSPGAPCNWTGSNPGTGFASGAGGGGGGFAEFDVAVTSGEEFSGVVGAAGTHAVSGGAAAVAGGDTGIGIGSLVVWARGGGLPTSAAGASAGGIGGGVNVTSGVIAPYHSMLIPGGDGSDGQNGMFVFAGNGGDSFCGLGGRAGNHGGEAGTDYGGGGGGSYDGSATGNFFSGADGAIGGLWIDFYSS